MKVLGNVSRLSEDQNNLNEVEGTALTRVGQSHACCKARAGAVGARRGREGDRLRTLIRPDGWCDAATGDAGRRRRGDETRMEAQEPSGVKRQARVTLCACRRGSCGK